METIRVVKKTEADGALSLRIPLGKPDVECEVVVVVQLKEALAGAKTPEERGRPQDPLDVRARLDELRTLRDGWLDGAGKAPPATGLDWLGEVLQRHFAEELPLPHLYPTPQGGIQAEWSLGPVEVSLEIDLERRRAHWHCLNSETRSEESRDTNLDEGADWKWLAEQIARKAEGWV